METNNNFIHDIVENDIKKGGKYYGKTVCTRFPPEPNGYLHIGHAKAIAVDFGTAENTAVIVTSDSTIPIRARKIRNM